LDPACFVYRPGVAGDTEKPVREETMNLEYFIIGFIALALLAYLMYALIRPEKF